MSTHILKPDEEGQVSFTGLTFSPDGSRIYLANVNGSIKVFSVNTNSEVAPLVSFPLPAADAPRRTKEIPAGLAVSRDGKTLYVVLNLSNRLAEMDAATGQRAAHLGCGRGPLRCGARRKQGLRQQLGRTPPRRPTASPARRAAARWSASIRCGISPAKARSP